jgi:hypothetical protein
MFSNMRVYNPQTMPLLQMRMRSRGPPVAANAGTREPVVRDLTTREPTVKEPSVDAEAAAAKKREDDRKRTAWGHPIWLFFHALSYKIKEESFPLVGQELLRLIHGIATNLPCPVCSDHARIYMKNINFLSIQTKEQFINFLFQFHNAVNSRKGYPLFPREEVDAKYSLAVLPAIFQQFERAYQDKAYNPKHIHDEYIRNRILRTMRSWFYSNYDKHFSP